MDLGIVLIIFFSLLVLSLPIAVVLASATSLYIIFVAKIPPTSIIQQLFNGLDNFVLVAVPLFVLAGNIMGEGKIAERLVATMNLIMGKRIGGLAIASVLSCMFFAAISGSSPATVIAIGSIMMPALIRKGYGESFSIGLLTSAGSLGILIPPSIPMILYALVMNVSVAEIFLAGFLPGFFIGGSLIIYSYIVSRINGWRSKEEYTLHDTKRTLKEAVWAIILPFIVLGGIYAGIFTPTEAASVSVIYAIVVEVFIYKQLTVKRVFEIARSSAILSACLLFILSCAMTFVWLLTIEQIPQKLANLIITSVKERWLFLLAINILFLLIGSLMDIVTAVIVISPILIETLKFFGIDPVHFGIIMIVNIECGFLTPPFGLNLFVAMAIMKKSLVEISKMVAPFLLIFFGCLLFITYFPKLSLILPELLFRR